MRPAYAIQRQAPDPTYYFPTVNALPPGTLTTTSYNNGTKLGRIYEYGGSDYLDDVSAALYDIDLRPDLTKTNGQKNNLTTYTVGFADSSLADDPLLGDAATRGGGMYIAAENASKLQEAFQNIANDISNQVELGSGSILGGNSTRLDTTSLVYQAGFKTDGWLGVLSAFGLRTVAETTDTNGNGILDPKGSMEDTEKWNAQSKIPSAVSRSLFSYNPTVTTGSKGISFEWANLTLAQKTALDPAATATNSDILNYIRGDQSKEQKKRRPLPGQGDVVGRYCQLRPVFCRQNRELWLRADTRRRRGFVHKF